MIDVHTLGRRFELTQCVDRRQRDEPVARGRRDRTLGEADRLLLVERERHAHQGAHTACFGRDRDDRRTRDGRESVIERAAAELDHRYHAPVELETERRERDRLHVAHDLLGVLALMGDDVHFGDPAVGFGDDPHDRYVGKPADLSLDFGQVQFVHVKLAHPWFFPSPARRH